MRLFEHVCTLCVAITILAPSLSSQAPTIGVISSGESGSLLNVGVSVPASAQCFPFGSLAILAVSLPAGGPGFCFPIGPSGCTHAACVPVGVDVGASVMFFMPSQAGALGAGNSLAWRFDYLGSLLTPVTLALSLHMQGLLLSPTGTISATDALALSLNQPSGDHELAHIASFASNTMRLHRIDTFSGAVTYLGDHVTGAPPSYINTLGRPETSSDGRFILGSFVDGTHNPGQIVAVDTAATPPASTFLPIATGEKLLAPAHFCPGTNVACALLGTTIPNTVACGGTQWQLSLGLFDVLSGTRLPDVVAETSCVPTDVTREWGFTADGGHVFYQRQEAWAPLKHAAVSVIGGTPQFGAFMPTYCGPASNSYFLSKSVTVPGGSRVLATTDAGGARYLHLVDIATGQQSGALLNPGRDVWDVAGDGSSVVLQGSANQWSFVDPQQAIGASLAVTPLTGFQSASTHAVALPGGRSMLISDSSGPGLIIRVEWDAFGTVHSERSVNSVACVPGGFATVFWTQGGNLSEVDVLTAQSGLWLPRQGAMLCCSQQFSLAMVEPSTLTFGSLVPNMSSGSCAINPVNITPALLSGNTLFR